MYSHTIDNAQCIRKMCTLFIVHIEKGGIIMIDLTAMNNARFTLNEDHIEKIESVPQTVITLDNGKKYLVLDSIDEIKNKIINYKRRIFIHQI